MATTAHSRASIDGRETGKPLPPGSPARPGASRASPHQRAGVASAGPSVVRSSRLHRAARRATVEGVLYKEVGRRLSVVVDPDSWKAKDISPIRPGDDDGPLWPRRRPAPRPDANAMCKRPSVRNPRWWLTGAALAGLTAMTLERRRKKR
jgi:hypothetical protein